MKWDTLKFASIHSDRGLEPSNRNRCTKASDMESDKYFLSYMHVVFCKRFLSFQSITQRRKPKCISRDHKSLVVSIKTQCVPCIDINKRSQNY